LKLEEENADAIANENENIRLDSSNQQQTQNGGCC
jgi:hypothetical protein